MPEGFWVLWYDGSMKKVIVKCQLRDRKDFEERMAEVGLEFAERFWLHDRIYLPRGYRRGLNLPRMALRTLVKKEGERPRYELILKRHIEDSDVEIENKTEVLDYAEAVRLMQQLGFEKRAEVARERRELEVSEKMKIYLDQLGEKDFVKFELVLNEGESVQSVQREIRNTLRVFGQKKEDFVEQAYFEM